MKERTVYSSAKETGLVRLDPEGCLLRGEESEAPPPPHAPVPPPEPALDVEALQQEAFRQGFLAGQQETRQALQQELLPLRQSLQHLVQQLPAQFQQQLEQVEPQLLKLALAVARKILHTELRQNPEVIRHVLQAALARARDQTVIAIHLHPADLEQMQSKFEDGRVELIPDSNLQRGGCRVETEVGEFDASIEAQWAAVEQGLKESAEP